MGGGGRGGEEKEEANGSRTRKQRGEAVVLFHLQNRKEEGTGGVRTRTHRQPPDLACWWVYSGFAFRVLSAPVGGGAAFLPRGEQRLVFAGCWQDTATWPGEGGCAFTVTQLLASGASIPLGAARLPHKPDAGFALAGARERPEIPQPHALALLVQGRGVLAVRVPCRGWRRMAEACEHPGQRWEG